MYYFLFRELREFRSSIEDNALARKAFIGGKFIFFESENDFIYDNIQNLGLSEEDYIYLPYVMTDLKVTPHSISLEEWEKEQTIISKNQVGEKIHYQIDELTYKVTVKNGFIVKIAYYDGPFQYVDHYTSCLTHRHTYCQGRLIDIIYYHQDGSRAYAVSHPKVMISKALQKVPFKTNDCLFFDWVMTKEDLIFEALKHQKLFFVDIMKGEHAIDKKRLFNEAHYTHTIKPAFLRHNTIEQWEEFDKSSFYWYIMQEYYERHIDKLTATISECIAQGELLSEQLQDLYQTEKAIFKICSKPVEVRGNQSPKDYRLVTMSRISIEKHPELCVKAVVKAKKVLPDLTYDIYGGSEAPDAQINRTFLQNLIDELGASDYITIHDWVTEPMSVLATYRTHLSGSLGEGCCHTLLEANACGLGHISYDVPWGPQEHIKNGQNGVLVDPHYKTEEELVDDLAEGIVRYFEGDLDSYRAYSQQLAQHYSTEKLALKWQDFEDWLQTQFFKD